MLVALFHSPLRDYSPEIINAMGLFRMPAFFFLSGVFFSFSLNAGQFLVQKADAILKPYFIVSICIGVVLISTPEETFLTVLMDILYGVGPTIPWTPMWFLTHLFILQCCGFFLLRCLGTSQRAKIWLSCLLFLLIMCSSMYIRAFWNYEIELFGKNTVLYGLPFSIDLIIQSSIYFLAGYFLRSFVKEFHIDVRILAISVIIFMCISLFTNAHIDLNLRIYDSPFFATVAAFSGIYILISVSYFIQNYQYFSIILTTFGKGSLFILIFHSPIANQSFELLSVYSKDNYPLLFLFAVIAFIVSLILPIIIMLIFQRSDMLALTMLPVKNNRLFRRVLKHET